MNIIIFEQKDLKTLYPFSINHASFEIKAGLYSNFERILSYFTKSDKIYLVVRKEIEKLIKERYPGCIVNPKVIPSGTFFDGSCIYSNSKSGYFFDKEITLKDFYIKIEKIFNHEKHNCKKVSFLWDLFKYNKELLLSDISTYKFNAITSFPTVDKFFKTINKKFESSFLINEKDIIINEDSILKAGVVIDATEGPVIIGKNVLVDIGALIQGPVFIDDNSYVSPGAKLKSGTFIGKHCKVGGEVSNSVICDYSNKVHDGFLGHSFIGQWVNIGAGTNNSNLKNNYGLVKFNFGDDKGYIDTNEQFLGSFIGDFTRLGILTMLNTGTHIGLGSNVFGEGFQKNYIHPFSWGKKNKVNFEKFIDTCKKMKLRRNLDLTKSEITFLKKIYDNT